MNRSKSATRQPLRQREKRRRFSQDAKSDELNGLSSRLSSLSTSSAPPRGRTHLTSSTSRSSSAIQNRPHPLNSSGSSINSSHYSMPSEPLTSIKDRAGGSHPNLRYSTLLSSKYDLQIWCTISPQRANRPFLITVPDLVSHRESLVILEVAAGRLLVETHRRHLHLSPHRI